MHNIIDPLIFRAYDIRGNSKKNIDPVLAYKIGFCLALSNINSSNNRICVGRDGRLSSPDIYTALIKGLTLGGAKVISIGIVPSPLLYFADHKLSPALSIMITGSHNPKNDNGFKIVKNTNSFYGDQLQQLYQDLITTKWPSEIPVELPLVEEISLDDDYVNVLLNGINVSNSLKIAWDPGNGAAGEIVKLLKSRLPNQNLVINQEINGEFPSHHPDPTVIENLQQLIALVAQEQCDLGFAFDGDGDRIGIVTKLGNIIWGDQMLSILGKDILASFPGASIIADVKASNVFFEQIKKYGGNPIMCRTGHAFVKAKLKETKALLAGEMSGHIFFADRYFGYDDALYTAIRFLELLSKQDLIIDELLAELPPAYSSPEIRIEVSDDLKFKIIEQLQQQMQDLGLAYNNIDGIRLDTENGWWLIRASNTQNALIARCESLTKEGLQMIKLELAQLLRPFDLKLPN